MTDLNVINRLIDRVDCCPWGTLAGRTVFAQAERRPARAVEIYTSEQRRRRDSSAWTIVQGVLAPIQFVIFLASLCFVLRYLLTGEGLGAATISVVVKTLALYAIMVTGSIWEHTVFGRYLFAPAFLWEDLTSVLVLALHTLYLAAFISGAVDPERLMIIALAAYASYVINAGQFVLKLRAARRQEQRWSRPLTNDLELFK